MMLRLIPVAVAKYLVSRHATRIDQMNGKYFSVQVIDQIELCLLVSRTARLLLTHFEQFLKRGHVVVESGNTNYCVLLFLSIIFISEPQNSNCSWQYI